MVLTEVSFPLPLSLAGQCSLHECWTCLHSINLGGSARRLAWESHIAWVRQMVDSALSHLNLFGPYVGCIINRVQAVIMSNVVC